MLVRVISKELQKQAIDELNENPERIRDDLRHMREWISKQSHLTVRTDEQWLLSVLRGCKFSLELAKEKIDRLCSIKTSMPEFFRNRDPFLPEIQELLSCGVLLPLRKSEVATTPRVILFRVIKCLEKLKIEDGIKLCLMIFDILLNEDDNFIIAGSHVLEDYKELSFNHFLQLTPTVAKKAFVCAFLTYPVRAKGFHIINASDLFMKAWNMCKPFFTNKILSRVHIYDKNSINNMYKTIPLSIIPKEYGGEGGSLNDLIDEWKAKVESYRDWFIEDSKYCSNETKRVADGILLNNDYLFGTEGSFRNLQVD